MFLQMYKSSDSTWLRPLTLKACEKNNASVKNAEKRWLILIWIDRTVADFAEAVENLSEAVVHGGQRLQLDLLEIFWALVLQVAVPFADAANNGGRLEQKKHLKFK